VAIAHNARGYDGQFILQRAILLKWRPELILNALKIICMNMEYQTFIDNISYLPKPLRKLPKAFELSVRKSWYPHYLNTKTNLNYVGPMPDVSQHGFDKMSVSERREFKAWYDKQKDMVFDNTRVLEKYSQDDVTVLRQACEIFRRDFIEI
jgi:hypothetical protein